MYESKKSEESKDENLVQRKGAAFEKKANNTGLPDSLKSGVESLSGYSMDDVKVHYNSPKPAQLNAHAYAQGSDIHLASGQEKHLPHEAWHVAQQKQGRVKPTTKVSGVDVNDNVQLEKEADVMGAKAVQMKVKGTTKNAVSEMSKSIVQKKNVAQLGREEEIGGDRQFIKLVLPGSGDKQWRTTSVEQQKEMSPLPSKKKQLSWVRAEESGGVEFTIAGPQAAGGVSDTGPNSIMQNIEQGIRLVEAQVTEFIGRGIAPDNITILIKAHSRNAVASTQIAKALRVQFYKEFGFENGFDKSPQIELVMFDPVPGPLHSGELTNTDVGIIPQSTLVYSLITQYAAGFSPQRVTGAQRLIISNQDHGVGTTSSFSLHGKEYEGYNLNSMPKGVFFGVGMADGVETLVQVLSTNRLMERLESAGAIAQAARIDTIEAVAKTFNLKVLPPAPIGKDKLD